MIPDGASLFEAMTPSGVWGLDRSASSDLAVDFVPCAVEGDRSVVEGGVELAGLGVLREEIGTADMVVVPTWPIARSPVPDALVEELRLAHETGARLVGLCLGAFAIAATGRLDGRTATTHWRHRERFEVAHPDVAYEPNVLYVDHDTIVTSAGSAAAIDCCLHLVRRDHGAEAAATVARSLVTAPHRSGAQSQFASAPPLVVDDPLSRALADAAERIAQVGGTDDLAALAGMSRRSLERTMRARLATSPARWIAEQRVVTACRLLELGDASIDEVAALAGYGSTPSLRRAMREERGTTPTGYRALFGRV